MLRRIVILVLFFVGHKEAIADQSLAALWQSAYPESGLLHYNYESSAFGDLKKFFRVNYNNYRQDIIASLGKNDIPVIYIEPDLTISLMYESQTYIYSGVDPQYPIFATLNHIPVDIYLIISRTKNIDLRNRRLLLLQKLIEDAIPAVHNLSIDAKARDSQIALLKLSDSFITKFMQEKEISQAELQLFANRLKPSMQAGVFAAVKVESKHLFAIIDKIQAITGKDTSKTRILFRGYPYPRQDSLIKYCLQQKYRFKQDTRLMSDETSHLIYIDEVAPGKEASMAVLATALQDEQFAEAFFGDKYILRTDPIGAAAMHYSSQRGN